MASPKMKQDTRIAKMQRLVEIENGKNIPLVHRCCKCGTTTATDFSKFACSYSTIYAANDFRLPICKSCLDDLYNDKYYPMLKDVYKAVRRICMKFDIYYSDELVFKAIEGQRPNKLMSFYVQKTTLQQYANKTYDTTIEAEAADAEKIDTFSDMDSSDVPEDTVKFWGFGYDPEDYEYLDYKYAGYATSYDIQSKAMESIFQKICMMELQILKGIQNNEKVDGLYRQLNDYMNAAGIQPKQSSENTMSDTASFGTLIKRWEDEKPVPEPAPEWKDVDGIRRYISVYFLGHLSKMFGFKNDWQQLYDDEIAKYTVNKPQYDNDEDNLITYEDIFGSGDLNG